MPENILHYSEHTGSKAEKFFKTTLFSGQHLMVGLNCLEPGQIQPVHDHKNQDKFYYIIEGSGHFTLGDEVTPAGPGHVVWAEAGMPHGVENKSTEPLTIFMGIAPPPGKKQKGM
ncbi:MAG: cupin domain-containing protein [bacterium]|nr:cupin domain-containing protein [bacterium]